MRASLEKLSEKIHSQTHLSPEEKEELLGLLAEVEEETSGDLPPDQVHPARESVQLAASVEEQSIPEKLKDGLLELEASHPKTTAALERIAHSLARMGI